MVRFWHIRLLFLGVLSCSGKSTQQLLDGEGLTEGKSAIRLNLPANGAVVTSEANLVHFVAGPVYYVDCASAGAYSAGTKTFPFKSLQAALDFITSVRQGNHSIAAEVRVAKGTCNEAITLKPNVNLLGGYDPAQGWVRNPMLYQSTLTTSAQTTVNGYGDLLPGYANALIEGFKIVTNANAVTVRAVEFTGATITLRYNHVEYTPTVTHAASFGMPAINVSGGANVTVDSNIIVVSSASTGSGHFVRGIYNTNSTLTARNNLFSLTTVANAVAAGIKTEATITATSTLTNNTIMVIEPAHNNGIGLEYDGSGITSSNTDRNILGFVINNSPQKRCGTQTNGAKLGSFRNNLLADCHANGDGFWNAGSDIGAGFTGNWGIVANLVTPTNIDMLLSPAAVSNVVNGCNGLCALVSGNRGGNSNTSAAHPGNPGIYFTAGYNAANPKTWVVKPNGPADMDSNGVYDAALDAGANPATAGLINIP